MAQGDMGRSLQSLQPLPTFRTTRISIMPKLQETKTLLGVPC